MSVTGSLPAEPDKLFKKSFHRRNDSSGELDVFEAARYFSGYNNDLSSAGSYINGGGTASFSHHHQKIIMKEDQRGWSRGSSTTGRISLDMPMRNVLNFPHHQHSHNYNQNHHLNHHYLHNHQVEIKQTKEKKYKQPSSPGGRLASFLNSLFNQSATKKKIKSKSTTTTSSQSMKEFDHQEDQSPGGRRKRRSSISHFRSSTSATTDSKSSIYSSSSSGFRTPPPYAQTPTKNYKEFRSFSDHPKQLVNNNTHGLSRNDNKPQRNDDGTDHQVVVERSSDLSWLDEKFKYSSTTTSSSSTTTTTSTTRNRLSSDHHDQIKENKLNTLLLEKNKIWVDDHNNKKYYPSDDHQTIIKKGSMIRSRFDDHDRDRDEDDGGDSDSSSDLFELQNYDLGCYSSGLPVYETTNMDSIKRGSSAPISNIAPVL